MAEPVRSGPILVRPAKVAPAGTDPARYFSASSSVLIATTGSDVEVPLELVEDVASVGMGLSGAQSILIDDEGYYFFSYFISFFSQATNGSSSITASLILSPSTTIPGSKMKGGASNTTGPRGIHYGMVSAGCICRLVGDGTFTVILQAIQDFDTRATHRTLTANRIAT